MLTRRGEGSNRSQAKRVVTGAIRPVLDQLEGRVLLAANPVVVFNFNTDPTGTGQVANTGSGGAAYNGTLAGPILPTFSNATPSPAGGGYLTFAGDGLFQGSGGRVDLASQLQGILGKSGSIAFYVRTSQTAVTGASAVWQAPAVTGVEQAGAGNDIFYGDLDVDGTMRGEGGDGAAAHSAVVNDGNWHQVTITRDSTSGQINVYTDGKLSQSVMSEKGDKTSPFNSIGALTTVDNAMTTVQGYNYLAGDLDQVEVYDTVLSAQDVATKYGTATTAPSTPVLTNKTTGPADARFAIGNVDNESAFNVLRADSAAGPFTQIAQLPADATTFSDSNVVAGQTYFYKVAALNNIGTTESAVLTIAVPTSGTGLKAFYYNTGFWGKTTRPADTSSISVGKPTKSTIVANVDYDWGNGGPTPPFTGTLNTDNFSTAFVGTLVIPKDFDGNPSVDSTYSVKLISNTDDDGGIIADNQIVSFDPQGHGQRDADASDTGGFVTSFNVTEGVPVDIVMLQAEQGGGAGAHMKWEVTSSDGTTTLINREVVPEDFLHTQEVPIAAAPTLNNVSLHDPYSVSIDFSDASTSELRFDILRSTGSTFNAATAQVVGVGPINGFNAIDGQAVPGQTYTYVVRAVNGDGFKDSAPMTFTVPAVTGGGATGHYFNNNNWSTGVTLPPMEGGVPDVNEVVSQVDFDYGNNPPDAGASIVPDNFSTIFTGKITIPDNGNGTPNEQLDVKIFGNSDDDGFLYVNGVLVSSDAGGHGQRDADTVAPDATHFVNTIKLTEGQSYNFVFFQRDTGGGAGAHIRWINPATGAREAVPTSALTSAFTGAAAAPTNLASPNVFLGAHQARITWTDNATNEVRYEVDRAVVTGGVVGTFSNIATLPINSTQFTDSGLTNSTTYAYRIRAYSYDGSGSTDIQVTTLDQDIPPTAPSNLAVLPRATGDLLIFTDNSVNESEFVVQRATVTGGVVGTFAEIGRVPGSNPGDSGGRFEFNDATAAKGTTYVYEVHAVNPGGNSADVVSGQVTAAAQGGVGVQATWYDNLDFTGASVTKNVPLFQDFGNGSPDPLIGPDQFSGILIGSIKAEFTEKYTFYTASDDGIDLTLIDPDTGKVLINFGGAGIGTRRGLAGGFSEAAGTADLVAGKSYIIQVRHVEDGGGAGYKVGWSSASLPQEIIPTDLAFAPTNTETLFAPSGVVGSSLGAEKITLNFFDPNIDDTGYVIERGTSQTGPFTQVGTIPGNVGVATQSFVDDGSVAPLAANQTYYYRIHAVRNAQVGANSTPVAVQTLIGGTDVVENGNAKVLPGPDGNLGTSADNVLQVTANAGNMDGSAFTKYAQTIVQPGKGSAGAPGFSTSFNLVVPAHSDPPADGFTFTIQRQSNTALGGGGGAVGFVGIPNSLGVHFRWYDNGNSISNVGIWTNGVADNTNEVATGGTDINGQPFGFLMTNGHNYKVDISYDDTNKAINLTVTDLTDTTVAPFTTQFTGQDVTAAIGGPIGYVGFTGATGGANAEQDISNWTFNGTAIPFVAPVSVAAPKVTNVYVSGSGWTTNFKNYLGSHALGDPTYGYNIAGGVNQLKDLPWTNLNQISIKFDSDVNVTQNSLVIHGVNTPVIATNGFSYDSTNHVATWTLASSLTKDKLNLGVLSAGVTLKSDPTVTLDGEFTTGVTTGASGDGTAGGDFNFRVNVLPGDLDQTSPVIAGDVSTVISSQFSTTVSPKYNALYDVDGSGAILAPDVSAVISAQFTRLPTADPVPSAPVAGSTVAAQSVTASVVASKPAKPVVVLPAKVPAFAVKRIKRNDLFN